MNLTKRIATRLTAQRREPRDLYDIETDRDDPIGDAMEDFAEKCSEEGCTGDLELEEAAQDMDGPFYTTVCPECGAIKTTHFSHPRELPWHSRR